MTPAVIALAGRRVDAEGSRKVVFPLKNELLVRQRIKLAFEEENAKAFVSSAACGADLLALEVAKELRICPIYIVLPFERTRFLRTSVADKPGLWDRRYNNAVDDAESLGNLILLEGIEDDDSAYKRVNHLILAEANRLAAAKQPPLRRIAIAVWEKPREGLDLTRDFLERAKKLDFLIREISTI
jgi:hypothetical protein